MPGYAELFKNPQQAAAIEWGCAPAEFAASKPMRRALSREVVDGWLDCSLLHHPFLKAFFDGRQVPVGMFASPRSVKGQTVTGLVDADKTRALFDEGATLMFCNLHEWHAPCRDLCRSLTGKLVAEVKATAFYSPPGCQGLATHRDDAHVFVVQLAGEKRWSVFDVATDPAERRSGAVDADGPERTFTLTPGDGLYLPPFAAHHCQAQSTSSLHLSLAVREPTTKDAVDVAIGRVLSAAEQRSELSGDATDRAARVGDVLKALAEQFALLDPADVVAAIETRVTGRTR